MAKVFTHHRFSFSNVVVLPVMIVLCLMVSLPAFAGQVSLAWTGNPDPAVAGYMLHYGQSSRSYPSKVDVGNTTTYTIAGLLEGQTYFYAVTAYDSSRTESAYSNEASSTIPYAPPAANFSSNVVSGIVPLTISFTNNSTGTITAYSWNFGDNTSSTSANPTHSYTTAGAYAVSLTVTGPGGTNTATKSGYIVATLPVPPIANFSAAPMSGTAPLSVAFSNQSTGTLTTYAWDFGDGATSIAANPTHAYAAPGSYSPSLTVSGVGGSNTKTRANLITVSAPITSPPVANFSANTTSGPAPLSVVFTSASTGSISSYAWNFGDGTTSAATNPTHAYAAAGSYSPSLTVSGAGGSNTKTQANLITVSAAIPAPVANFSANTTSGPAPLSVVFTSASTGSISSYAWNFGDGSSSTMQNSTHSYAAAGTYSVSLTVTGSGGSNTQTKTNYISVAQPTTGTGSLAGSAAASSASVNVSSVGTTDWAHWPGYDHKASGGTQISTYTKIGPGTVYSYNNDLRMISWSAGTPVVSGSNQGGVFIAGTGNGFQVNAPADTSVRTLAVYIGGWSSGGKLTAHLSDNSAADYVNSSLSGSGQYDGVYALTYKAASAGQTISVNWTQASGSGNVTLQGAALSSAAVAPPTGGATCPCNLWNNAATPIVAAEADTAAVELGVKFRSDKNGLITGIRFYKANTNTGTHIGSLWNSSGQLLAQATFTSETASGWQQVNFATPVAISANTMYIASYHTNGGHYANDDGYFATAGVDNGPLHALRDGVSGSNGVYAYSANPAFPNSSYQATNYWADVVFTPAN